MDALQWMFCIGHRAPRTGEFGCLLIGLPCAHAMRQSTLWTVTDEPPESQTAPKVERWNRENGISASPSLLAP
jgi:hypothetical protein